MDHTDEINGQQTRRHRKRDDFGGRQNDGLIGGGSCVDSCGGRVNVGRPSFGKSPRVHRSLLRFKDCDRKFLKDGTRVDGKV